MIFDSAIYIDGPWSTPRSLEEAHDARHGRGGFAWIGLYKPTEEEFASVTGEFEAHLRVRLARCSLGTTLRRLQTLRLVMIAASRGVARGTPPAYGREHSPGSCLEPRALVRIARRESI